VVIREILKVTDYILKVTRCQGYSCSLCRQLVRRLCDELLMKIGNTDYVRLGSSHIRDLEYLDNNIFVITCMLAMLRAGIVFGDVCLSAQNV